MRYKLALTLAYGVFAGAFFAASQFAIELWPQLLEELWYSSARPLALLVLAAAVGAAVGRWWAMFGALGPPLVAVPLQLSGHVTPWHDPARPLDAGNAPAIAAILAAVTLAAALARNRLGPRQPWSRLDEH